MKLNQLELTYFRCFEAFNMRFAPDTTVLIGKNGTGKTALVRSITNALSFIFATNKNLMPNSSLSAGNPYLKIANIAPSEVWWNEKERVAANYVSIRAQATFQREELEWELTKASTSNAGLRTTNYEKAYRQFMERAGETGELPLLACYSDSFPHITTRISKFAQEVLEAGGTPLRNWGYYQWADESSCAYMWQLRYQNCYIKWLNGKQREMVLEEELNRNSKLTTPRLEEIREKKQKELAIRKIENERYYNEWNTICEQLRRFSNSISQEMNDNFEVNALVAEQRGEEWKLILIMGERSVPFDQLPAGYKRLYYMVLDIAYRSYMLNGDCQSGGIVLIDEIDLHLHPTLEKEVLKRFRTTFPNIQFIVSTHSPLVIANLNSKEGESGGERNNRVYRMVTGEKEPHLLPNLFGVDYNSSVADFMDTEARDVEMQELIDNYVILKHKGQEEKAKEVHNQIVAHTGELNICY